MENSKRKSPYVLEVEPEKTYAWCACGKSNNLPHCDGSHQGTTFTPVIETFTEKKTVAICGCAKSANAHYCDGSHKKD